MKEQISIEQKNEAIAIFEGRKKAHVNQKGKVDIFWSDPTGTNPLYSNGLYYHLSWDELMPVVEKIAKIPLHNPDGTVCAHPQDTCHPITFNMPTEDGKQVMFRFKGFSLHTADKLIDAAYAAVYEVVEYHNTQKEKQ